MKARIRRLVWMAWALACVGCGTGRAFLASSGDYADYRRVRLGATVDERIAAAWSYLKVHPTGRYAEEIRGFVERAEPVYFRVRARNAAGLAAYVAAIPDGPRTPEALDSMMVLRNEVRREPLEERAARVTRLRVEYEERSRQFVATTLEWWMRSLLTPEPWRGMFVDAPPGILAAFRLVPSPPECETRDDGQSCTKQVHRVYRVRGNDAEVARRFDLTIELSLDPAYRLAGIRLSGTDLALAVDEAESGSVVSEPGAASAAWRDLLARLSLALPTGASGCRLTSETGDSMVWRAACSSPSVTISASRASDGREVIEVTRLKGRGTGSTTRTHER